MAIAGDFISKQGGSIFNDLSIPKLINWIATYEEQIVVPARERRAHAQKIALNEQNAIMDANKLLEEKNSPERQKISKPLMECIIQSVNLKKEIIEIKKQAWYINYRFEKIQATKLFNKNKRIEAFTELGDKYKFALLPLFNKGIQLRSLIKKEDQYIHKLEKFDKK